MREWTVLQLRLSASPHLAAATQPLALTAPGFGPASPGLSPASLGLGPVSPGFSPMSPGFGPASPDLSPTSLGLGPMSSDFGPMSPGFGPMSPGFGPISSWWSFAQHPPSGTSRQNQTRISDPPASHHSGQKEAILSCSLAPAWLLAPEASRKLPWGCSGLRQALSPRLLRNGSGGRGTELSLPVVCLGAQTMFEEEGNRGASWVPSFCRETEVRLQSNEANLFCCSRTDLI